eukprot:6092349-Prorocentrum_lima.AAC.1
MGKVKAMIKTLQVPLLALPDLGVSKEAYRMPCSVAYRGLKKVLPGFGKAGKGGGKGGQTGPQVVTQFPGNTTRIGSC